VSDLVSNVLSTEIINKANDVVTNLSLPMTVGFVLRGIISGAIDSAFLTVIVLGFEVFICWLV